VEIGRTGAARQSWENEMASEEKMGGWVFFAGIMMILVGAWDIIEGISGVIQGADMPHQAEAIIGDIQVWSWFHLMFGLIIFLTGFGVLNVSAWARMVGIVLIGLNLLSRLITVQHNPYLSMLMVVIDVVIIYALAVYHDAYTEAKNP
jgi:hypothetical protein